MDIIKTNLTKLIKENPKWLECLTKYPNSTKHFTSKQMIDYKSLDENNYNTIDTYQLIKKLLSSRGIRSVHPAWFFILKEYFENDNFIFEEKTIDNLGIINFSNPNNFDMPHKIQIIGTLKIYYTLLTHSKIKECFIQEESKFTKSYFEFKEIYKYLFFPEIEKQVDEKSIDFSYKFSKIMKSIEIEINEPEHNKQNDSKRAKFIYFKTTSRIIDCDLSKEVRTQNNNVFEIINNCINVIMPKLIDNIFFRMTMSIYNENKFAGLTFNAFVKNIMSNLFLAIFFSELKKESIAQTLTWNNFLEYCCNVRIKVKKDFIKVIEDKLSNNIETRIEQLSGCFHNYNKFIEIIKHKLVDDADKQIEQLNKYFYNYAKLNFSPLLTERGYGHYLMQLTTNNTPYAFDIQDMYLKYKEEYDKLMDEILTEKLEELKFLRDYAWSKEHFLEMAAKCNFDTDNN